MSTITTPYAESTDLNEVNITALHSVAFGGMFRLGELCYEPRDLTNRKVFEATRLCREDVTFAEDDAYAAIRLKRSKGDSEFESTTIYLSPSPVACPIQAPRRLFTLDKRKPIDPLFHIRGACTKKKGIAALKSRMVATGLDPASFTGHSFRKGAASEAARRGVTYDDIQLLGRWRSDAARLYIRNDPQRMLNLAYQASHGLLPPVFGLRTPPSSP